MRELLLLVTLSFFIGISCQQSDQPAEVQSETIAAKDTTSPKPPKVELDMYGFPYDSASVSDFRVQPNESLYEILDRYDVSPQKIFTIANEAEKVVNLRSFRPGQSYRIYASSDTSGQISRMVWQPDAVDYVVFDWQDSLNVYKEQKEIETKRAVGSAEITSSLYEAMMEENLTPLLANKLSEVYAWEIDFFSLRKGDSFKVYYEQKFVDGEFYGTGEILAAEFTHRGETHKAFHFENEEVDGFFDEDGNSLQKALLKAPFNYSQRISSHFNPNRFHPVLKRRVPHTGVDYAAPHGTPVISVGDGTVLEARYKGANGNYVKVRHNSTYETAYLHLTGFAKGIRSGTSVEQGQVIGYVGATGRVTGTHLHYTLYKNGQYVNPLKVDLPASDAVPDRSMAEYDQVRQYLQQKLDQIQEKQEHHT